MKIKEIKLPFINLNDKKNQIWKIEIYSPNIDSFDFFKGKYEKYNSQIYIKKSKIVCRSKSFEFVLFFHLIFLFKISFSVCYSRF